MRTEYVPANEQYRLIMECRSSGLSDYQWCREHSIQPGTFYNWIKRLRTKGSYEIPNRVSSVSSANEVVKIEYQNNSFQKQEPISNPVVSQQPTVSAIELCYANTTLRVPNGPHAACSNPSYSEGTVMLGDIAAADEIYLVTGFTDMSVKRQTVGGANCILFSTNASFNRRVKSGCGTLTAV